MKRAKYRRADSMDARAAPGALTIYTDGAARPNPGPAGYGYVIIRSDGPPVEGSGHIGRRTNNQAEYVAMIRALERALDLGPDLRVTLYSDSELMVRQVTGQYRINSDELRDLYWQAWRLIVDFSRAVTFTHVYRRYNAWADALSKRALDGGCSLKRISGPPIFRP